MALEVTYHMPKTKALKCCYLNIIELSLKVKICVDLAPYIVSLALFKIFCCIIMKDTTQLQAIDTH